MIDRRSLKRDGSCYKVATGHDASPAKKLHKKATDLWRAATPSFYGHKERLALRLINLGINCKWGMSTSDNLHGVVVEQMMQEPSGNMS